MTTLPQKVLGIHRALLGAEVAHAFGGALALAYYAVPRATVDIDVNVFVTVARAGRVARSLASVGVDDRWTADPAFVDAGQVRAWWGDTPVDLFFSSDAIHVEMAERVRSVPFGDASIPVLAPEHLLACKAIFDRRKDWIDIEQMLLAADDLDAGAARRWIERIAGAGDQRLVRFDRAVAEVRGP